MIIIGIDGALTTTGICVYDTVSKEILRYSKITTKYGDINNKSEDEKIFFICDAILAMCKVWNVECAVLEDQYTGKNARVGLQLSRLRGALTYALMSNCINLKIMNTSTINKTLKKINGFVIECEDKKMTTYHYIKSIYKDNDKIADIGEFVNKDNKNKNSDIYDAIAIATSYGYING